MRVIDRAGSFNMLRVREIAKIGTEVVEANHYLFEIHWPQSQGHPLYWRAGMVSNSLVEIGMHYRSGTLISVNVLLARQVYAWPQSRPSILDLGTIEKGVPVFEVEQSWVSDPDLMIVDSSSDVLFYVSKHRIALDFGDYRRVVRNLCSGRIIFGIDQEGKLHTVEIGDLLGDEMQAVRKFFHCEK